MTIALAHDFDIGMLIQQTHLFPVKQSQADSAEALPLILKYLDEISFKVVLLKPQKRALRF